VAALARGPTGRTVLVVGPDADTTSLGAQVGSRLPAWQRSLDAIVVLPSAPAPTADLAPITARYPTPRLVTVPTEGRIDLGGGAVLDLYATGSNAAAIRFGSVWIRLSGRPPPPSDAADFDAPVDVYAPAANDAQALGSGAAPRSGPDPSPATDRALVSDGTALWRAPP
jgi:hypothetical protein